jgi:general secretion pathway protein M
VSWKSRYDALAEREKKLLLVFLAVLGVMTLVFFPLLVRLGVSEQAAQNERLREVTQLILDERVTLGRKQAETRRIEARYGTPAPELPGLLARTAESVGMEIPESQERSPVPHGKTFTERSMRLSLKRVGMLALTNFMERLTTSGHPIIVSKLEIKKRDGTPDSYDVTLDVSAYVREEKKPKAAAGSPDAADGEEEK